MIVLRHEDRWCAGDRIASDTPCDDARPYYFLNNMKDYGSLFMVSGPTRYGDKVIGTTTRADQEAARTRRPVGRKFLTTCPIRRCLTARPCHDRRILLAAVHPRGSRPTPRHANFRVLRYAG